MHVRKYDETRESNLDRVKKIIPCPKGAREHSVTSLGGKPVSSLPFPGRDVLLDYDPSSNFSKSRKFYLASGYEERVGEVFESRATRLNARKSARVKGMHIRGARRTGRAAGVNGRRAGVRAGARAAGARGSGRAWARGGARLCDYGCTVHPRARLSPKIT
ncbi:hypothetical protein CRG98_001900 [Punica granatum]|uniref:Uncharacterized protein n=1 Tax=Punica granatum TaxID=22663 RepID=A0A2I0LBY1_PUNGR|nr:hypothetical protein CRG98_001900 [Punica granatum]